MVNLYRRLTAVLQELERRFHKDLRRKREDRFFRLEIDLEGAKILLITILLAVLRFLIILFGDVDEGYRAFTEHRHHAHGVETATEYRTYRGRVRLFTATTGIVVVLASSISGLALNLFTGVYQMAQAATYAWTQTQWTTLSSNTTGHPAPNNWSQYSATSSSIVGGNSITLSLISASLSQTSDTDFSGGAFATTTIAGSGSGASISLSTSSPASYSLGASTGPGSITFDPSTNSLWVILYGTERLVKINPLTGGVIGSYYAGTNPYGVTFDSSTNSIWVAAYGDAKLRKYRASDGALLGAYNSASCTSLAYDPSTTSIWCVQSGFATYYKYNASTGALVNSWVLPASAKGYFVIDDPGTNSVWINGIVNYGIYKINTTTGGATGYTVDLSSTSYSPLVYDSNANAIWVVTPAGGGRIKKYRTSDGTMLASSTVSYHSGTSGLGFDPITNSVWEVNSTASKLYKINNTNGIIVGTSTLVGGASIAYDPSTYSMWVTSPGTDSLNKVPVTDIYFSLGTFTSSVVDAGANVAWTTLSYNATIPASTSLTVDARAGDTSTPDGTWSAWQSGIASGGDISGFAGKRYMQYRVNMSTSVATATPLFNDITLNYNKYPSGQTLTSSAFDSTQGANLLGAVSWNEDATLPSGTYVALLLRATTTSAQLATTTWYTMTSTTTGCSKAGGAVTCPGTTLPASFRSGVNNQWFQYQVTLSSDGQFTPTVSSVSVSYVVNAKPELQNVTATEQADGTVLISYDTRDPDSTTGSYTPGFISPSFEYSTDDGTTWTPITGNLDANSTTTKAVSEVGWNTYTTTWTAKNILNGMYSTTTKIRVTANDNEAANNTVQLATLAFTLDEKNPDFAPTPLVVKAIYSPALVTINGSDDSSFQMKVGRMPDLSDAAWGPYASSTTISLVAEPDTVYVQFRDVFQNTSNIVSVTTPKTPTNMIIRDLSNITASPNEYRLFVAWGVIPTPGSGFGFYRVFRSTDGSTYDSYSNINTRTTNYVLDDNSSTWLNSTTTYSYKLYSEDVDGNTSYYSAIVSDRPDGQGGTDLTPPTITGVDATTTSQTAVITWTTDELSDSTVGYCSAPCASYSTIQGISSFVTAHEVVIPGLTPGATYNFAVYSEDPVNNTASSTGHTFTMTAGAEITNVAVMRASNTSADITWATDIPASSYVVYATNTPPIGGTQTEYGIASLETNHVVTLHGLVSGQTYYFYVKSQDSGGNWSIDERTVNGVKEYYSLATTNDTTPPTLSSITATNIWDTAVTVVWNTDELADSYVEWSANSGYYATSSVRTTFDMAHYVELTGLSPSQTYYFRVRSTDTSGNTATSAEQHFSTLEEQIGKSRQVINTTIVSGGGGGTTIVGIAKEEYQRVKTQLEETAAKLERALAELSTIKNEVLGIKEGEELSPKQLLDIITQKFSELGGRFTKEAKLDLTEEDITPATKTLRELAEAVPPPIVLGKPDVNVAPQKTIINWETDKETNAVVAFAREDQYSPSADDPYAQQIGNFDVFEKIHNIELTDLAPSTEYHFQIRSFTPLGAIVKTRDYTFRTSVQMPEIYESRLLKKTEHGATIAWRTNVLANSAVRIIPVRKGIAQEKEGKIIGKSSYVREHEVEIVDLEAATAYQIELISTDPFGNITQSDFTSIFTGQDSTPPTISQVKTDVTIFPGNEQKIQSIVQWNTDEPSTSQVLYEEVVGTSTESAPRFSSQKQSELSTSHTVLITGWKPNTIYRIRTLSIDESGNTANSKDYMIRTPTKKASIIDVIISNFSSTFGWTKNIGF